jgi:hypothetical protein
MAHDSVLRETLVILVEASTAQSELQRALRASSAAARPRTPVAVGEERMRARRADVTFLSAH